MTERLRPHLINKGDALVQVAECLLATPPARLGPEAVARRAARRYTSAGDAYHHARLGLLAKRCQERAAQLWDSIGEKDLALAVRRWAEAIPVYWDGDV